MTNGTRIALNVIATYGRTVLAIAIGLFSSRWVLNGLGKSDFGLYGLVGAIIALVGYLNTVISGSVSRFYAFEIGAVSLLDREEGVLRLQKWFNTALLLHVAVGCVLVLIAYPAGLIAIRNFLSIPQDRVFSCEVVLSFAAFSSLIAMVSAPYIAMFYATQNIVEMSFWGVCSTVMVGVSAFSVGFYDGDRLIFYSAMLVSSHVIISLVQIFRARILFPACRMSMGLLFSPTRMRSLIGYTGWQTYATFGELVRAQGSAVLVNLGWGSIVNAAYTVSNQVSAQASSFATALQNAISPAVNEEAGTGDLKRLAYFTHLSNRFCMILVLVFLIPLVVEIDLVLKLWLLDPPPYANVLCACALIMLFVEKTAGGQAMAICASGKVGLYQFCAGTFAILTLVIIWIGIKMGGSPLVIGLSFIVLNVAKTLARAILAKEIVNFGLVNWFCKDVLPVVLIGCFSTVICLGVRWALPPLLVRVVLSGFGSLMVCFVLGWFAVLGAEERGRLKKAGFDFVGRIFR